MPTLGTAFGGSASAAVGGSSARWADPAQERIVQARALCGSLRALAQGLMNAGILHVVWKILTASVCHRLDYDC
eukprot:427282-Lingulodinium_polyedra.AAC.1